MYQSLKGHYEKGQIILDEPAIILEQSKLIITILHSHENASANEPNGKKAMEIMKQISQSGSFMEIENPIAWQKEMRKDRQLPSR